MGRRDRALNENALTWRRAAEEAHAYSKVRNDLDERTLLALVAHFVRLQAGSAMSEVARARIKTDQAVRV